MRFEWEDASRLVICWFILCAVMGIGFCIGLGYLIYQLASLLR